MAGDFLLTRNKQANNLEFDTAPDLQYHALSFKPEKGRTRMATRVTIKRRDRTIVFPVSERDQLKDLLKDKIWWDRRSNRWSGRGDLEEIKQILEDAGYEVRLSGPPAKS